MRGAPTTTAGDAPLTASSGAEGGGHVPERALVGLPATRRDARPDPDRPLLLRLHRRRHRPLRDRRRPAAGPPLGARAGPGEGRHLVLGQPAAHLHPRHRRGDGARQRGHERRAAAPAHPRSAARVGPRRARDHRAADLLRGAASRTTSSSARASPSSTTPPRARPAAAARTRTPGRHGAARPASGWTRRSRDCCSRSGSATSTC